MLDGGIIDDEEFERVFARSGRFRTLYVDFARSLDCEAAPDAQAVADWARQQAINGRSVAQVTWGHMLLDGFGVARDPEAALRWFLIASRSGDAEAMNMAGRCFELGWGTSVDCSEAARWYRHAADAGHAWAQFNLATLLAQGRGVPADEPLALSLLVKSARQGNAKAMNMLGRYREEQTGGKAGRMQRAAALWYRWAAHRGCFRGQFHHARMLAVSGKSGEAITWFSRSLGQAPDDFRRDAVSELSRHSDPAVQRLAQGAIGGGA
jgi:TPR repeat protein